jgi:DEAD/DEAH box helicase domain-containing protein
VPIRGVEEEFYTVVDITNMSPSGDPKILEEVEVSRAIFEV